MNTRKGAHQLAIVPAIDRNLHEPSSYCVTNSAGFHILFCQKYIQSEVLPELTSSQC